VSDRPFKVLGVQQIAIGGEDKHKLRRLWVDILGVPMVGSFRSTQENVDEDILRVGSGLSSCEIDLMQPIDPNARPAVHSPPLNHIGLWIDDLPAAVRWLEGKGVRFAAGGIRKGAGGRDVCFIHPRSNGEFPLSGEGILIELVQAPPELIDS
jgi:lactoylglutathione lyase